MSVEQPTANRLHCLASVNPFHNGHLALFQKGLEHARGIDLNIGRKARIHRLPWEVRKNAVEIALLRAGIQERIQILTETKEAVTPEFYGGTLIGSNLLLTLLGLGPKRMHPAEIAWFKRFRRFVVCEREDGQVTPEVLERAADFAQIDVCTTNQRHLSGSLLRTLLRDGKDIEHNLPDGVWEVVKPHVETLKKVDSKETLSLN